MAKNTPAHTTNYSIPDLVKRVEKLLRCQEASSTERILIALAGVPGSGKSTVSQTVVSALAARGVEDVAILPMDGFHYTRKVLSSFEDPIHAFKMRGAPFTFDAQSFVDLVTTLKRTPVASNSKSERFILAPSFDHAAKDPVSDSIAVSTRTRMVIVEGNYTLLDENPWNEIPKLCAERWFVDAPIDEIRSRLAKRHVAAGIEETMEAAVERANSNDIPNGNMIRARLIRPDVYINN